MKDAGESNGIYLGRGPADQLVGQALNRLRLAVAEVRVVERRREGEVVSRSIANYDAIARARKVYAEAAHAIGVVRQAEGLCDGPQRPTRGMLQKALVLLESYRVEIEKLQALS
jgi:hypothetical protein